MGKKNETEYPRYKTREECPCQCLCPCCTRIGDRVISRKPKRNGLVRVERYCDCLFCGPFSFELEIMPEFIDGEMIRHGPIQQPYRLLGAHKNAEIKNRR